MSLDDGGDEVSERIRGAEFHCNFGADPGAGEAGDVKLFRRTIVPRQVIALLHPCHLAFLLFVESVGESGAEHGGEADGAGVETPEDEGVSRSLSGEGSKQFVQWMLFGFAYRRRFDLHSANLEQSWSMRCM